MLCSRDFQQIVSQENSSWTNIEIFKKGFPKTYVCLNKRVFNEKYHLPNIINVLFMKRALFKTKTPAAELPKDSRGMVREGVI